MALGLSFLTSYRSGEKGYDFSYRFTDLYEQESVPFGKSYSFVKFDIHYIGGSNPELIDPEICGPLVVGEDGLESDEIVPKQSWTMLLSLQKGLFFNLCCLFASNILRKFGVPDDVTRSLLPDLFDFAMAAQNQNGKTQILVSIDVCTLQYEGETEEDVSARTITSSTFSSWFFITKDLLYLADKGLHVDMITLRNQWFFHSLLDVEDCPICLEGNVPGKMCTGVRLPCSHIYHGRCILGWLVLNRIPTCPLCRSNIFDGAALDLKNCFF